jgi:hypothetical protein
LDFQERRRKMNLCRNATFTFAAALMTLCACHAVSPGPLWAQAPDVSGEYHSSWGDVKLTQGGFPPVVTGVLKRDRGDVYLIGFLRDNGRLLLLFAGQLEDGSAVLDVAPDGDRIEGTIRLHRSGRRLAWNLWK